MRSRQIRLIFGVSIIFLLMSTLIVMQVIQPGEQDVLSLGDSYTIGEGVEESERWPVQMVSELKKQGVSLNAPKIIATTGWTTDELQAAIDQAPMIGSTYGWVTLLIGVNNQYRGRDVEVFRKDFQKLLRFAIERANGRSERVIVLSIPDWGVTPFAASRDAAKIASEIDTFNRVKREETVALRAHYVDITDISREAKQAPKEWLAPDELHPSGGMYRRWAQRAAEVVREELAKAKTGS
jgi:lysophospholipase L1-like esterase